MGGISLLFALRQEALESSLSIKDSDNLKLIKDDLIRKIKKNTTNTISELKNLTTIQKKDKPYLKFYGLMQKFILQLEREGTISTDALSEARVLDKMDTLDVIRYYLRGEMSKNALMTSRNSSRPRRYSAERLVNILEEEELSNISEEKIVDLFEKRVIDNDILNELEKRGYINKKTITELIINRYNKTPFNGRIIIKLCVDGFIKPNQLIDLIRENGLTEEDVKKFFNPLKTTKFLINDEIETSYFERLINLYAQEQRYQYLNKIFICLNNYAKETNNWNKYLLVLSSLAQMTDNDNRKQWKEILKEQEINYKIIELYQDNKIDETTLCDTFNNGILGFEDLQLAYDEDENIHIFDALNNGILSPRLIPEKVLTDGLIGTDNRGGKLELETLYKSYIDGELDISKFGDIYERYKEEVKKQKNKEDNSDGYPLLPDIIHQDNINIEKLKELYERGYLKYRDLFDFHNEGMIKEEDITEIAGSADESYIEIFENGRDIVSIEGDSVPVVYPKGEGNMPNEGSKKTATRETEFLSKGVRLAFFKRLGAGLTKKIIRRLYI